MFPRFSLLPEDEILFEFSPEMIQIKRYSIKKNK